MEQLYCDASFYNGVGGMAVVVPKENRCWEGLRDWCKKWRVSEFKHEKDAVSVFYSGCLCLDANEAEMRALGMAFILASRLINLRGDRRVVINSDSLLAIHEAVSKDQRYSFSSAIQDLWRDSRIIISKVKAHSGNRGNELADEWARAARLDAAKRLRVPQIKREGINTMKMPFKKTYQEERNPGKKNPFAGATEMDIVTLTEQVLNDEKNVGYVTSDGRVMPRNDAFKNGDRDGLQLVKDRIWG